MPQISANLGISAEKHAFESDVVSLTPALRAFALRFCHTKDDVDDLVQETLLKALRFRHNFEPGTRLKAWLFTIMRNHYCSQFRSRKRETPMENEQLEALLITRPGQEWSLYEQDVAKAIDRMPEAFRSVLLHVTAGASYEDAAQSAGCEVGTVKSRVSRARRQLAQQFTDLFVRSEARM